MQALTRTALVGTANMGGDVATIAAVDELLPAGTPEQRLLWQAGGLAVYSAAGMLPGQAALQPPAEADPVPEIPGTLTSITAACIAGELGGLADWLAARTARANRRLPHALLPAVFAKPATFDLWWPVMGRRGHWLATQHPDWRTMLAAKQAPTEDEASLKRIWEEGGMPARVRALTALRNRDAAQARELLAAVLPKEKAEQRQAFVAVLLHGLSADDEAMLEGLLDDRSQAVRQAVADLLLRLPKSALSQRMVARADACLRWQPVAAPSGTVAKLASFLGKRAEPVLELDVPNELPKDWERDGIVVNPPYGEGPRAFWLRQLVSAIPPAHWSARAAATPAATLDLMAAQEWAETLLAGCVAATCRFGDADWAEPMLQRALAEPKLLLQHQEPLFQVVREESRIELLCRQLIEGNLHVARRCLDSMAAPWPKVVAQTIVKALAKREPDEVVQHYEVTNLVQLTLLRVHDADLATLAPLIDIYARQLAAGLTDKIRNLDRARDIVTLAQARQTIIKEMPL